jgi:hypothetical protein
MRRCLNPEGPGSCSVGDEREEFADTFFGVAPGDVRLADDSDEVMPVDDGELDGDGGLGGGRIVGDRSGLRFLFGWRLDRRFPGSAKGAPECGTAKGRRCQDSGNQPRLQGWPSRLRAQVRGRRASLRDPRYPVMESGSHSLHSACQLVGDRAQARLNPGRCCLKAAVHAGQCPVQGSFNSGCRPLPPLGQMRAEIFLKMMDSGGRGGGGRNGVV